MPEERDVFTVRGGIAVYTRSEEARQKVRDIFRRFNIPYEETPKDAFTTFKVPNVPENISEQVTFDVGVVYAYENNATLWLPFPPSWAKFNITEHTYRSAVERLRLFRPPSFS